MGFQNNHQKGLIRKLFFAILLLLPGYLITGQGLPNYSNCDSATGISNSPDNENCVDELGSVPAWKAGNFSENESRIITITMTGDWAIGQLPIIIKADQIDCKVDYITGPVCVGGGCDIIALSEGDQDGFDCTDDPAAGVANAVVDVPHGSFDRRFTYLGHRVIDANTTEFYYCVTDQYERISENCMSGTGPDKMNLCATISHISFLAPLCTPGGDCVDPMFNVLTTHPGCDESQGSVTISEVTIDPYKLEYKKVADGSFTLESASATGSTTISNLDPDDYVIRVSDPQDESCFTEKMVTVNDPPDPSFGVDVQQPDCNGTAAKVTFTGVGYSSGEYCIEYWVGTTEPGDPALILNIGDATMSPFLSPNTTYTFRLTEKVSGFDCSSTQEVTFDDVQTVSFQVTPTQPDCFSPTGKVTFTNIMASNCTMEYWKGAIADENTSDIQITTCEDDFMLTGLEAGETYTFKLEGRFPIEDDEGFITCVAYQMVTFDPALVCYSYDGSDPCVCEADGLFSEIVTITGPSGKFLKVDPVGILPEELAGDIGGALFSENSSMPGNGISTYTLSFNHEDGKGFFFYVIEVPTEGSQVGERIKDFSDNVLTFSNICAYPKISVETIPMYCFEDDPIDLTSFVTVTPNNVALNGTLRVFVTAPGQSRVEMSTFDPGAAISEGDYLIEYEFTTGDPVSGDIETGEPVGYPEGCVVSTATSLRLDPCKDIPVFPFGKFLLFGLMIFTLGGVLIYRIRT